MSTVETKLVAVIGAGLMGHAIANEFALAGINVRLHDLTEERVRHGIDEISQDLQFLVRNDLARAEDVQPTLARIRGLTDLAQAVEGADLVVEAVVEDLGVKQDLFGRLEGICPKHAVLASNTSGLSVNQIAAATGCPERVIVAHHYTPAHLIPLVEVVPGEKTAPATVEFTCGLLRRCDKQPVVLRKDIPGLLGNRMQFALYREAMALVEEGVASPEDVDLVVEMTFGRRLAVTGPLKSGDLAGLDVYLSICGYLFKDLDCAAEPPRRLVHEVGKGNLGAKTGRGIYDWPPEKLEKVKAAREQQLIHMLKLDRK